MAKILIVDDSAFQRKILQDMVEELGHQVVTAASGEEAIPIMDENNVDLVCLDLLMPGLSGVGVLEHYQAKPGVPPIIIISADIQVAKREECMSLGASAFINKYINKDELELRINEILN